MKLAKFFIFSIILFSIGFLNPAYSQRGTGTTTMIAMGGPIEGTITGFGNDDITGIAVDEENNRLYVSGYRSNKITLVEIGQSIIDNMIIGTAGGPGMDSVDGMATGIKNPTGIVYSNFDGYAYVANSYVHSPYTLTNIGETVTISLSDLIPDNAISTGVALNQMTGKVYIAVYNHDIVLVMNPSNNDQPAAANFLGQIFVGRGPAGIAIDSATNTIYVANSLDDSISVVDGFTNEVTETISLDFSPSGIVFIPSSNKLYITKRSNIPLVNILDIGSGTISTTSEPPVDVENIAYDPLTNRIYVIDHYRDQLIVISTLTDTVIATYNIANPRSVEVYPLSRAVYVGTSDGIIYVLADRKIPLERHVSSGLGNYLKNTVKKIASIFKGSTRENFFKEDNASIVDSLSL